jgi:ribosomal protein L16 Arg81 hydroxylase
MSEFIAEEKKPFADEVLRLLKENNRLLKDNNAILISIADDIRKIKVNTQ